MPEVIVFPDALFFLLFLSYRGLSSLAFSDTKYYGFLVLATCSAWWYTHPRPVRVPGFVTLG